MKAEPVFLCREGGESVWIVHASITRVNICLYYHLRVNTSAKDSTERLLASRLGNKHETLHAQHIGVWPRRPVET
jgi:hypothetical protein